MNLAFVFSLVALLCYAALLILVVRRGLHIRVHQVFALYLTSMLIGQIAACVVSLSQSTVRVLFWYRISIATTFAQLILFFFIARIQVRIHVSRLNTILAMVAFTSVVTLLYTDQGLFLAHIHRHPVTGLLVPDFGILLIPIAVMSYTFLGLGIAALVQAFRSAASDSERNRLRYLIISIVISLLGTMANLFPALVGYPVDVAGNIISAMLLSYAILRYQLLDITLVVRRGLAYSILTVGLATIYLLSIWLFERFVRSVLGPGALLIPIILAMSAAVLMQPWRDRAQAWVDRLLFREKYDSRRMLQELSKSTATIIDLEALGRMMLSELCRSMRLERAALLLREESSGALFVAAEQGLEGPVSELRLTRSHPVVQWLQNSDRPLHVREVETAPQFHSLWGDEQEVLKRLGAQLLVPLLVKNELVGILAVGPKLTGEMHSGEEELTLSTLANQTAVAVENAHLFATTKARVAELTTLQDIAVRLVAARSLPLVLRVVVERGVELLHADEAHIALWDPANNRMGTHCGATADGQPCDLSETSAANLPIEMAARYDKPMVIGDMWMQAAIAPSLAREGRARAIAAYPLSRENTPVGVLAVIHNRAHNFAEDELRLLGMLCDVATLAIDNAQLLESEQAKRKLADTLREVAGVIGSTLMSDVLLELILEQLQKVVDYDGAAIMLLRNNQLEVSSVRGLPRDYLNVGRTLPLGQFPLFTDIIRERRPIMSGDTTRDERWHIGVADLPLRASIGVPLLVHDQVRGILVMGKSEPSHYTPDDLQNVVAFANQAAIAIENARLYEETIQEKRKTETILRESFSGIVFTDVDLRIVTFNTGAETITGFAAEDVIGRPLPEVLGAGIVAPSSPLGRVMATGERVPPQETVIQAASGVRDILQGTVALHDSSQTLFGYLISFADITRLKEVDRLKTDIVANVSHELRTPLASIKAYTELLLDNIEGEDRDMRDQFLSVIDREADRLAELISELLDLSRMEAGRFEVRKVRLKLSQLVSDVLQLLDVQRKSRGLTLRADMPDDLPDIVADREMALIILKNLLGNAIKFSRPGDEVLLVLRPTPEHLLLQVVDHGIGIPEDAIPHLFQKFYRVRSTTESGIEGTGLGLVLTKQAVEAHGGTIEVTSQVGKGTTFTVRLPWQ